MSGDVVVSVATGVGGLDGGAMVVGMFALGWCEAVLVLLREIVECKSD